MQRSESSPAPRPSPVDEPRLSSSQPWILLALLLTSSCKGCAERKPYTPFTIDGGAPSEDASSTASATAPSASGFAAVEAVPATSADSFPLEPGRVPAPPGRVFVSGLPIDADGDGALDLFAWVETPDHTKGELWFVKGTDRAGHGTTLASPPKDLGDASCKRDVRLSRVGASTVLARVDARCAELAVHSWFAVVRLHDAGNKAEPHDPELRLEGRLEPRSPGETLTLGFSAADRDGDKIDDLALDLGLEGVSEPYEATGKIAVPITFLDRPAGFARDPAEPEATFTKIAAGLVAKARNAKTAGEVFGAASQLLRAATITCDELGAPLLSTNAGPIRCGDDRFVGEAIYAVGLAGITQGDVPRAIAAANTLAELKPAADKRAKELDAALAKAAPIVDAAIVRRVTAAPARGGVLAPITFDADGNLLVVGDDGVTRVAASDFAEDKSDAVAWPRTIAWQAGGTEFALLGAARRCSPSAVVVTGKVSGGPVDTALPTVWGLVPGPSRGACKEADLGLAPLVTEGSGTLLAVGADVVRVESSGSGLLARRAALPDAKAPPSLPGAGRSPDGSAIALPIAGSAELLVVGPKSTRRWKSEELRDASSCVPRRGGDRVACVTKTGVVLVEPR